MANPEATKGADADEIEEGEEAAEASPRMRAHVNVKEIPHVHEQSGKDFATEHMVSEYEHNSTLKTPLNMSGKVP